MYRILKRNRTRGDTRFSATSLLGPLSKKWEILICNGAFTHALIYPFTFSWQWIARLDKTKLPHGRHIEIYRKCEKAVYCDTEYEIEEAAWELCNIGSFSIVCIFNDNFNSLINYN